MKSQSSVSEKPLRIAMIGAGQLATAMHYPSLTSMPDIEIAAMCDMNPERLNLIGDRFGVSKRYTNYRTMLEETAPDAVYAIGPSHHMYDIWIDCLKRGLNLFIEKPMGLTLHQAETLAWLADKHDCITQVGFQRRSAPLAVKLYNECRKRGPITHALCRFYKCAPSPLHGAADHMMEDGVHSIDTLRWLCGGEIVRIQSVTRRVGTPDTNFISALIEFDTGATGLLINSWSSGRRIFDIEIHAPGICAELEHEGKGYLHADGDTTGIEFDTREVSGSDQIHVYGGFHAKSREFLDAVRNGTRPSSHFGDAVKTMAAAVEILSQTHFEKRP
ncbi:gfo/Idh/MocA family oxidoreductase [Opitutaceae bacterium TAV4]|nr:gfo/Idh/MocA family oxidoreductase [Opitutaceae bacterium TAV4]RRJ99133.1 gfo/Idh/MocA family oxidoreductase [Opitutaceae bacterium TAV3]